MSQEQLAQTNRIVLAAQRETHSADAHDRLKRIAKRKFTTTFIFALAEFERSFGHLWGHGKPEGDLNEIEHVNRRLWEVVRQNILNNGNTQSRALQAELDLHAVSFRGYRMDLRGIEHENGNWSKVRTSPGMTCRCASPRPATRITNSRSCSTT